VTDLLAARSQMAMSLAFHIVFAIVGMAMPLLMIIAEGMWLRTGDPLWKELAKRWSKGTAILFAVGAVSGTVLSFELGLLWPHFMAHAGPIISMPFSLEGFAFFLEAIFLGIYLYGWGKVGRVAHLLAGVGVFLCGMASAIFVVAANGWMNTPQGFTIAADGTWGEIDPWAAMFNEAFPTQALHMVLAALCSVGFAVAGVHAWMLLRDHRHEFHRRGLAIALAVGGVFALIQPLSGDLSAKMVARTQPVKLAALEGHWETEANAPLRIGGWPDEAAETTPYSIELPGMLSWLAFGDTEAVVMGLKDVPPEDRPPVLITHLAFQVMVGCGTVLAGVSVLIGALALRRRELPCDRWLLWLIVLVSPLGFVATEAGWVVTEVGRQPWVVQGLLRTADAVTPMPHLIVPFTAFTALYALLAVVVVVLLRRQVFDVGPVPDTTHD